MSLNCCGCVWTSNSCTLISFMVSHLSPMITWVKLCSQHRKHETSFTSIAIQSVETLFTAWLFPLSLSLSLSLSLPQLLLLAIVLLQGPSTTLQRSPCVQLTLLLCRALPSLPLGPHLELSIQLRPRPQPQLLPFTPQLKPTLQRILSQLHKAICLIPRSTINKATSNWYCSKEAHVVFVCYLWYCSWLRYGLYHWTWVLELVSNFCYFGLGKDCHIFVRDFS